MVLLLGFVEGTNIGLAHGRGSLDHFVEQLTAQTQRVARADRRVTRVEEHAEQLHLVERQRLLSWSFKVLCAWPDREQSAVCRVEIGALLFSSWAVVLNHSIFEYVGGFVFFHLSRILCLRQSSILGFVGSFSIGRAGSWNFPASRSPLSC